MTLMIDGLRSQLSDLNDELALLTRRDAVDLTYQSAGVETDSLFLYGIVGGKDVGKTTLINQLAGAAISIDTDILDEGTSVAVAYCHEVDRAVLEKRLMADAEGRVRYVTHNRDVLRNVVLVDFPDFDSRFVTHREDVIRLGQHLQGMVWVVTPRKYGDHEFVERLENVVQSNQNYFIVLNKVDQLDGRVDLQAVRQEVLQYLEHECQVRRLPPLAPERLLLISARRPDAYEFPLLHDRLIRVHSPAEIARAKAENIRAEFEKNLSRMQAHYELDRRIEEVDRTLAFLNEEIQSRFPGEYFETVQQRLLLLEPIQRRISQGLFQQRVETWPVLRYLCYPFAGLIGFLAGRFAMPGRSLESGESPRDLFRYEGVPLSTRLQQIHLALEERIPFPTPELAEVPDYTPIADREVASLLQQYEDRIIKKIQGGMHSPTLARRGLVYFPLIWFPLLQPFLLELTNDNDPLLSFGTTKDVLAFLITLLSAAALLQSLVFLILFYIVWMLLLYAHGARKVVQQGEEEFQALWFENFLPWVSAQLARPLQELRALWIDKRTTLQRIEEDVQAELVKILEAA